MHHQFIHDIEMVSGFPFSSVTHIVKAVCHSDLAASSLDLAFGHLPNDTIAPTFCSASSRCSSGKDGTHPKSSTSIWTSNISHTNHL